MMREYFVRGQRKTVEEVDDVVAVKVPVIDRGDPGLRTTTVGPEASAVATSMPSETTEAFRRAQWYFIEPPVAAGRELTTLEAIPEVEAAGKLVKRPNGRFGIVTKRLNVQLREDLSEKDAERSLTERGLNLVTRLRFAPNLFEVDTTTHADALDASVELRNDSRFILAEPSLIEHVPARLTPTDPQYGRQWKWSNTGQNGGAAGADVHAEAAWDRTRGAGVRVAVIDNGFNAAHEDLRAGVVGQSGFFRQVGGSPVTFVPGIVGMPGSDHGTFCAGMVGARQGNGRGGCGAAPECELMLVACLNDQVGTQTTLARALSYAANPSLEVAGADPASGADIIVSSLGPNDADWDLTETLRLALEFAASQGRGGLGVNIFWAASNGENVNVMLDEVVSHPDVIAVVRSTKADREDNAARGPAVDLIAPGVDVFSTTGNGSYGSSTGTSFAAPCAAGCAALALSVNPAMTRDDLRQVMFDSADKIGNVVYDANGHNDDYGFGRVNAERAVALAEALTRNAVHQGNAVALVRQTPGWSTIPVAFANGDGTWKITNGEAGEFITSWAAQPGVRIISGDFSANGLTDIALIRQTPGWNTIPIAFANGDGTWKITNNEAPDFITNWASQPGVRIISGDFNGNGLTDIALIRQTPGWNTIPIAFANGDGTWKITNAQAGEFIANWASQPGVRIAPGAFR